jgi:hypothetical protein
MDHATFQELAAGAAIEDLDPDEQRAFDRHLDGCASCRRLSADMGAVIGELALAAPVLHPPSTLRGEVFAALRTASPAPAALGPTGSIATVPSPGAVRRSMPERLWQWGGLAMAAAVAVVAVGLGTENLRLGAELAAADGALAGARAELAARQAAVAVAADPGHVTVAMHPEPVAPTARAVVMYRPGTEEAFLMATDLPATPTGQVYQLWYADAAGVHALGTFPYDGDGPFVAPFGVDLSSSAAAMVTLEPAGGAVGEPGPQVIFGEL